VKRMLSAFRQPPARMRGSGIEQSRRSYADGAWDCFAALRELSRYSQLIGYLRELHIRPDVLDIGCGRGLFRRRLPNDSFGSYLGVDALPEAIASAQTCADDRTRFLVGDVFALDAESFDVVVANEVLYLLDDLDAVLEQVTRLLRPDGVVIASNYVHGASALVRRGLDRHFDLVDAVHVRNPANRAAPRGWEVTCHRNRR
jgi:2-polyprenyl-3-methyl-5-hydroxy-6-metoxy-1,4-benzoquinol methylase